MNLKINTKISLFLITWLTLILLSSFILFYTFKGFTADFWKAVLEMAIRGLTNFGSLFLLFSFAIHFLEQKIPWKQQIIKRLVANLFVIVVSTFAVTWLNLLLGPPSIARNIEPFFQFAFIISFFQCLAVFLLIEGWYSFQRNRQLEWSLSQLEKEKLATELTALRQQVNPHFLFNSLNVLSELMHENLEKADDFIQHFSRIYRYVLDINQEAVVTVQQEVDFLQSYLFLHQIRFGNDLSMQIELDADALKQFIPPLSLQLLFENVVKHNVISST
ncbi:MAG: histidine kinase [Bacteroidota bacterium]